MLGVLILTVLAGKIVISLAAASPTQFWLTSLGWISNTWRARKVRRMQREMARKTAGTMFSAELSFLPQGIGLAIDPRNQLLFLAEQNGSAITSTLLPIEALEAIRRGQSNISGFHDHYVELKLHEGKKPTWRLLCGDHPGLAAEVERAIAALA